MDNIKVSIFGSDGYVCQIPRIKEGMQELGHVVTNDKPDLIYSNDPRGYEESIKLKEKNPNSYLILNFLDIPWHIPNVEEQTKLLVKKYFSIADSITTISFKVQKDLSKFYNKKITVIYNPIKDVYLNKDIKKNNIFLYVGRVFDPVKRFKLVKESLSKIKDGENNLKVCGLKNPNFGKYLGIIKDQELNTIYNSSKFVLLPSMAEGLGLPMIESMVCGSIPITCSDNLTAKEFSPSNFTCEPNSQSLISKINELDKDYDVYRNTALKLGEKYKKKFNKKSIAENIINIFNLR